METNGEIHIFDIEHVILGALVSWEASEVGGNYSFRECSDIDEDGATVAQRFFKKIVKGVSTKTLQINDGKYTCHKCGRSIAFEEQTKDYDCCFRDFKLRVLFFS